MLHPDAAREIYCELRIPATAEPEGLLLASAVAGIRASFACSSRFPSKEWVEAFAYTQGHVYGMPWLFAAKS